MFISKRKILYYFNISSKCNTIIITTKIKYYSITVAELITTSTIGLSFSSVFAYDIFCIVFIPADILPNIVCLPIQDKKYIYHPTKE